MTKSSGTKPTSTFCLASIPPASLLSEMLKTRSIYNEFTSFRRKNSNFINKGYIALTTWTSIKREKENNLVKMYDVW